MKRLILVRHATAVDKGPEGSDFHRRLKKRGKREAMLMADRVATMVEPPDQLLSSPADRALETAHLFAERLGVPTGRVALREELYGGLEPDEFLRIVQRFDNHANNVMVFGHDPSFTEFAAYLIPSFRESIPKAGVLVMEIDRPRWRAVRPGDARVVHFERPPAPDVQKRIDEDVMERLVLAIRSGILTGVRGIGLESSGEVTRLIARATTRLARELRPFVHTSEIKNAQPKPARSHRGGTAPDAKKSERSRDAKRRRPRRRSA